MCSMLRIPVSMHNVPADEIFRPAAWNAFGMDKEGADYRACANFGPLYGTNHKGSRGGEGYVFFLFRRKERTKEKSIGLFSRKCFLVRTF